MRPMLDETPPVTAPAGQDDKLHAAVAVYPDHHQHSLSSSPVFTLMPSAHT